MFQVSLAAKQLIDALLQRDPARRLGSNTGADEIKRHPFFRQINWPRIRTMVNTIPFKHLHQVSKFQHIKLEQQVPEKQIFKIKCICFSLDADSTIIRSSPSINWERSKSQWFEMWRCSAQSFIRQWRFLKDLNPSRKIESELTVYYYMRYNECPISAQEEKILKSNVMALGWKKRDIYDMLGDFEMVKITFVAFKIALKHVFNQSKSILMRFSWIQIDFKVLRACFWVILIRRRSSRVLCPPPHI